MDVRVNGARRGRMVFGVLAGALMGAAVLLGSSAPAQADTTTAAGQDVSIKAVCGYQVTTDWLRFRTSPGTEAATKYQKKKGSWVNGYSDKTVVEDGYTWRKMTDGTWTATMYLKKGSCQT